MTPIEAKVEVEKLIAMFRVVMPKASEREINEAVLDATHAAWDTPPKLAKDYGMLRVALADITGDARYRSHA